MKKFQITLLMAVLLLGSITISASTKDKTDIFEANLLVGLNSNNTGLQVSCAYFLGELKSQKALIPMMRLLRNGDCYGARAMAALSLIKIGDRRGIFLIRREATFNDSEKFRKLCKHLYKAYLVEQFYENLKTNENLTLN